jgi:hypothetical protein
MLSQQRFFECFFCGRTLIGFRIDRKYCSPGHRQAAYRARRHAEKTLTKLSGVKVRVAK